MTNTISSILDFNRSPSAVFMVVVNDQISYMGADYGPPDLPPSMETRKFTKIITFDTQDELLKWIEKNDNPIYGCHDPYKVFKITPVEVKKQTSITIV